MYRSESEELKSAKWNSAAWWICFLGLLFHIHRLGLALQFFDTHQIEHVYLRSPTLFPAVQAAMNCFWTILVLWNTEKVNFVLLFVWIGATLQGQFAYIVGSLYHPARYPLIDNLFAPVAAKNWHAFVAINLAILILPVAILAKSRIQK